MLKLQYFLTARIDAQKRCKGISFIILIDSDRKVNGSSHWRVSTHCCRWWLESVKKSGSVSSTLIRRLSKVIPVLDYGSTSRSPTNAVLVSTLIHIHADIFTRTSAWMHVQTCTNRCEIELYLREREKESFFSETSDSFLCEHRALGRFAVRIRTGDIDEIPCATRTIAGGSRRNSQVRRDPANSNRFRWLREYLLRIRT